MNEKSKNAPLEKLQGAYDFIVHTSLILTLIPCLIASDRIIENDSLAIVIAFASTYFLVMLAGSAGVLSERIDNKAVSMEILEIPEQGNSEDYYSRPHVLFLRPEDMGKAADAYLRN